MATKEILIEDIKKIDGQIEVVTRQVDNSDYNITGLIAQKSRHMDRRDALEADKTRLEIELSALPAEEPAGV